MVKKQDSRASYSANAFFTDPLSCDYLFAEASAQYRVTDICFNRGTCLSQIRDKSLQRANLVIINSTNVQINAVLLFGSHLQICLTSPIYCTRQDIPLNLSLSKSKAMQQVVGVYHRGFPCFFHQLQPSQLSMFPDLRVFQTMNSSFRATLSFRAHYL